MIALLIAADSAVEELPPTGDSQELVESIRTAISRVYDIQRDISRQDMEALFNREKLKSRKW